MKRVFTRSEIVFMDLGHERTRQAADLTLEKRTVDIKTGVVVRQSFFTHRIDPFLQWVETALNAVDCYRDRIFQLEIPRVLVQQGREISAECHVVADENTVPGRQSQTHRFVIRITETDRKATAFEFTVEIHDTEHLHSVS